MNFSQWWELLSLATASKAPSCLARSVRCIASHVIERLP